MFDKANPKPVCEWENSNAFLDPIVRAKYGLPPLKEDGE
jgi:hypothetical protein